MELFKPKDVLKANPRLRFIGGEHFARLLIHFLRFDKLNRIYNQVGDQKGLDFVDELIKILKINYVLDSEELHKRIPGQGAAIIVCNHPFGGLESFLLIKILSQVRQDVKIVSNQLLQKIEPISEFFIEQHVVKRKSDKRNNNISWDKASAHLEKNGLLCLFPSGEFSQFDASRGLSDKQWQQNTLKFIRQQKVPVIPIHFQGKNSRMFYLMENIRSSLKIMNLPTAVLYRHKNPVKIRIGNAISVADQDKFPDIYQYGRYLRAKTYLLSSKIEVKKFFSYSLKRQKRAEPIVEPVSQEKIIQELNGLKAECLLFSIKNYSVYCTPSNNIPNILLEIGRLREITFRQVGEGTNRSVDLDEYDLYYNQLFIWDTETEMIVGAYRIGKGEEIMHKYGVRGFYINSLFKIKDDLNEMLQHAMEFGRSFIIKEYQRKPMPLFLLWKGILFYSLQNPEYRYWMGPVSISDVYSTSSKEMIIKFIMANYFNWKIAKSVSPRNAYQFKTNDQNLNTIMQSMDNDINSLDKFIGDVDEMNSGLPVLLKKYIKLNAKIVGFNVDPKFNNSLDGFIVLDIFDIPTNTIESFSKEINDSSMLQQFFINREKNGK